MTEPARRRIDLRALGPARGYYFLISAIVPRPIAWVTTRSADGVTNLAPFSFFQGVCADPPTLLLSIMRHKNSGEMKDTLHNIETTGEFVVNLVGEESLLPMVQSSAELPHGVSEIDAGGLSTFPAELVSPPCLADSPVNIECRLQQQVPVGVATVILGEILLVHAREDVLDERGSVDPAKLRPVARLGGSRYVLFDPDRIRSVPRP